jgi:hypothetical protein
VKPKVLVCVLCGPERTSWISPALSERLIETVRTCPYVEVRNVFGVYGYDAARNRAAEMFLQSGADWLCMLDNDNAPPSGFMPRVLDFANSRSDVGVVALPYYIRTEVDTPGNLILCVGWHAAEAGYFNLPTQLESGWLEIEVGGTGCMFIRRKVLTTVAPPWFTIPDYAQRKHLLGGACEDFAFCDKARAGGFHIWTKGDMICGHLHTVDLAAMADSLVVRRQEDRAFLEKMGIHVPAIRVVPTMSGRERVA